MPAVLLDTDILSELLKLRDPIVQRRALGYTRHEGPIAFSAITRYEILRGLKQQNAIAQLARFATFCQNSLVLSISDAILDRASDLWAQAYFGGHPRNDADLMIAATALEHGRILVTGNSRHFAWIAGLTIEDWRKP